MPPADAASAGRDAPARRTSRGIPIIPALDGFRGYALLAVVLVHLLGASGALVAIDGTAAATVVWGVFGNVIDAFFIVSGFGLFLAVASRGGELGSLSRYAITRAARVFPAFWLCLGVMLVMLAVAPPNPDVVPRAGAGFPSVRDIAIHLPAMQMPARLLDAGLPVGFGLNGPLWMVSVIVGFYLVFPLIAKPYYRHPLWGLAIAAAISLAWREGAQHAEGIFTSIEGGSVPSWILALIVTDQLPGWAFSFALGMTGAWAYVKYRANQGPDAVWSGALPVAIVGLVACIVCGYFYGIGAAEAGGALSGSAARNDPILAVAYSAARALLMAGVALGPLWLRRPFVTRATTRLAELSYSTYLIHVPIAIYLGLIVLHLPTSGSLGDVMLWIAVVIPVSFLYAAAAVRLVERPANRWARRVVNRGARAREPRAAAPAPSAP